MTGTRLADRPHDAAPDAEARRLLRRLVAASAPSFRASAPVEVHTLLSGDHVPLYLFAAKSLARFWSDVAPVVHDDGTLEARDRARLRRHVGGIRIVDRVEADARVEPLLHDSPRLASARRRNLRLLQLVDFFVLAEAELVVAMDSDVVFLARPDELIEWSSSSRPGDPVFLYSPEEGWEPRGIDWIPEVLPGVPYVSYMCCGFVAARRSEFFDLDYLDRLAGRLPDDVLYADRYVTQMFYSLLGGRLGSDRVRSLGEPYRSGRLRWLPPAERRVICHYFASHERSTWGESLVQERPLLERALG